MPLLRHEMPSPGKVAPLARELILWRYMSVPRFFNLLEGNLYFPNIHSSRALNDPLEAVPLARQAETMAALSAAGVLGSDAEREIINAGPEWTRKSMMDSWLSPADRTNYFWSCFGDFIVKQRAISCWFSGEHESAGMWQAFAREEVAVSIRLRNLEGGARSESQLLGFSSSLRESRQDAALVRSSA